MARLVGERSVFDSQWPPRIWAGTGQGMALQAMAWEVLVPEDKRIRRTTMDPIQSWPARGWCAASGFKRNPRSHVDNTGGLAIETKPAWLFIMNRSALGLWGRAAPQEELGDETCLFGQGSVRLLGGKSGRPGLPGGDDARNAPGLNAFRIVHPRMSRELK